MDPYWPKVQTFHPQLWRVVCGYELNPAVREELLQEVLLAIWKSLPHLRDADMLLPFILRIAHNMGASHVRSATRAPTQLSFDDSLHDVAEDGPGANPAQRQWLFQALATLPLNLRQPLMLQLEGFDYQQIADMLGIAAENVGVRLHRARARLKALYEKENAP